jgi:hypothetical protein
MQRHRSGVAITMYAVRDVSWDEKRLTWNTRPDLDAVLGTVNIDKPADQTMSIDETKFVRAERAAGRRVMRIAFARRRIQRRSCALTHARRKSSALNW